MNHNPVNRWKKSIKKVVEEFATDPNVDKLSNRELLKTLVEHLDKQFDKWAKEPQNPANW